MVKNKNRDAVGCWIIKLYKHNKRLLLFEGKLEAIEWLYCRRMIWLDLSFTKTMLNEVLRMFWEKVGARNQDADYFNNSNMMINNNSCHGKSLIESGQLNTVALRC